jgi:hypothetical protein
MKQFLNDINYAAIETRASSLLQPNPGSLPNAPDYTKMRVISLGGVLRGAHRQWSGEHSDNFAQECAVKDIVDGSGEWTALAEARRGTQSRYLIFGDYAGFAPIFYALVPGRAVIVSDSFHGAVQGFTRIGGGVTLNIGNYVTLLTGRERAFETLVGSETMANEIRLLRPSQALHVTAEKVHLVDREELTSLATNNDYSRVLTAAVEHTSKVISGFVSQNQDHKPIITLSGGVDSRLVLAFLKDTSFLKDFRVWTMDPRTQKSAAQRAIYNRDAEIANEIRKTYKLDWMSPRRMHKFSWSFAESLARHQSYNSNFSFKYQPSRYFLYEADPILTLRGGGGEILRGTAGAASASQAYIRYEREGGELGPLDWATENLLQRSILTNEIQSIARNYVHTQLALQGHDSVRETMDAHYRDHRNRAHFGHYRMSAGKNDQILQVLSNPYIQRLIDLVDYDYLSSSGVVADLFDATEPKLRQFPFESSSAHSDLYVNRRGLFGREKPEFVFSDREGWTDDFDELKHHAIPHKYSVLWEPGIRGEATNENLQELALEWVINGFNIVEDLSPADFRSDMVNLHKRIVTRLENKQLNLGRIVAIVASTVDLVVPMDCHSARHFFTDRSSDPQVEPDDVFHRASRKYKRLLTE